MEIAMKVRNGLGLYVVAAAAWFSEPASACKPVVFEPHGFPITMDERVGVALPANARGVTFVNAKDGVAVPVSATDFILADRYGRSVPVRVMPMQGASSSGQFFIGPVGGFVAGERYTLKAPGVHPEPNSPYAGEISITVGNALPPDALERDATIITGRRTEVLITGESGRYAARIGRDVKSDAVPPQTDCDFGITSSIRSPDGCHVVKASIWFPEMDERQVRLAALICGRWLAIPWRVDG
ncbi:hypothetical protein [Luteibacter sp.]|uniref:hypothetical protein n=1 Tax=Luteibacter sp. TaxID=1886636 RepID=UPI002F3EDB91